MLWQFYEKIQNYETHKIDYSLKRISSVIGHCKQSIIDANTALECNQIISLNKSHRKVTLTILLESVLPIKQGGFVYSLSKELLPNRVSNSYSIYPVLSISNLSNKTTTNNVHSYNEEAVVVFKESVRKEEPVNMKFDWIDDLSLESLIKKHGEKYVLDRAIPINRANGKIKDKKSCLEDSLKLGYIYTCKELKEQEQKEKHKKYVDEQIEKNRLEQEERERLFSERDPEAGNKAIAEFLSKIDEADKKINLKTFFP